jgi:CubicO group peptidase (beta-lactamase class C family)
MKPLLPLIILLSFSLSESQAQTGLYVPEMAILDTSFIDFMSTWNIPGASISVVREGRLVYARGFGYANIEQQELATPTHTFRVASISKSITGIIFMKMIEDGLLSIDDVVFGDDGILTDSIYTNIKDSRVETITIRQLLQHTSGWGFVNNGNSDPMFLNAAVANFMGVAKPARPEVTIQYMLQNEMLKSDPGTTYFYSNFGYLILGRVVEKLTGQTYETYARSILQEYAGISEMRIGKNRIEDRFDNEVTYYDHDGASLANSIYGDGTQVPWPYGGFHLEGMDSHGGWIASSVDLARLMVGVDGFATKPDFLSAESITLMATPSTANGSYAMGFAVSSNGIWWHNGSLPGTTSLWVKATSGTIWAVLLNTRTQNVFDLNNAIDAFMWQELSKVGSWPEHDLFLLDDVSIQTDDSSTPKGFELHQNYPNPFNPTTTISYELNESSRVRLTVLDAIGRELDILVDEHHASGTYSVQFSAQDLASGIYFYRLDVGDRTTLRKMTLIK